MVQPVRSPGRISPMTRTIYAALYEDEEEMSSETEDREDEDPQRPQQQEDEQQRPQQQRPQRHRNTRRQISAAFLHMTRWGRAKGFLMKVGTLDVVMLVSLS